MFENNQFALCSCCIHRRIPVFWLIFIWKWVYWEKFCVIFCSFCIKCFVRWFNYFISIKKSIVFCMKIMKCSVNDCILLSGTWKKAKWTLIEKINFSCLNYAILTTKITTYCVINWLNPNLFREIIVYFFDICPNNFYTFDMFLLLLG